MSSAEQFGPRAPTGIIGGFGFRLITGLQPMGEAGDEQPWGEPSAPLRGGRIASAQVCFLARHGEPASIPPHRVNYRANLWALKEAGVRDVISVNAVGGIRQDLAPGDLLVPDQIVDYTHGREHTYCEGGTGPVLHVDFTQPYSEVLRRWLLDGAERAGESLHDGGTYGATQGPRLETAAEIDRFDRDGCDVVGMTGMPEAVLARELGLRYVSLSMVANRAAGRGTTDIHTELEQVLARAVERTGLLLSRALEQPVSPPAPA